MSYTISQMDREWWVIETNSAGRAIANDATAALSALGGAV